MSLLSRRAVNGIYLVLPPAGLLCMYLSPLFTARERAVRTMLMASFFAAFQSVGPELHQYVSTELVRLSTLN